MTDYSDKNSRNGVSLRDWFAGQAMNEMFRLNRDYAKATGKAQHVLYESAKDSYKYADAMLAAREPQA